MNPDRQRILDSAAVARALELRDLSDPQAGPHAMSRIVDAVEVALGREHPSVCCAVHRSARVVDTKDNYDNLGYEPGAIARDSRYTRYVGEGSMLRSHTSAMIPPLLRAIASSDDPGRREDRILLCPGIVYRRDAIDRTHTGEPHQLDVWRICPGSPALGVSDLRRMIATVVQAALGDVEVRTSATSHPYTLDGLEIEIREGSTGRWLEIGECGLAHPAVLAGAGLDPKRWSGLAMGLGLDRLVMIAKGIDDIRLLRARDPRIADQMTDLSSYRPVSSMPPIVRDLSVVVPDNDAVEDIGDRVREALGADAESIEQVSLVSRTSYEDLPVVARERLAIRPDQQNVLVRVVFRALARTMNGEEANELRDRVYAAIHGGAVAEWASAARRRSALTP